MPLRVSNSCEKNVISSPVNPIVVPNNTATTVLADITKTQGEWAGRYIQNVGANDCYYAFGHTCDPTNFNGILSKPGTTNANGDGSGQQLDASNHGQSVSVYSVGGTKIAVTILIREDLKYGIASSSALS